MKNEIAFESCDNCMEVARILVEEGNVVLISREEALWILNYEYSEHSNRNDVVFMSQDEFYDALDDEQNDEASTMNQWIPCNERLPEQGKSVLVTYIYNGKRFVAESWYIGQHDERGNPLFSSCADEYKASDLYFQKIAWMPLPEPWKGEQE